MFYTNTRSPVKELIPGSRSAPTLPAPGVRFALAMTPNTSDSELEFCPRCIHQTLLSEPSDQGERVCLRCGALSVPKPPWRTVLPGLAVA
jgi:hypothetical protein